ncbi:MAG TPA: rhomboid-like protein [Jatrophihabitans sp.]|nr:rhomboid-like protein [Jatrophihabitans sp.]
MAGTVTATRTYRSRTALAQVLPSPTATPLATGMVLLLLLDTLTLRLRPGDADAVAAWASTNLHNLAHHPLAAMLTSTFVMTGGLLPDLLLVAVGFAILERAVGARPTALIALAGQVIATLLTEYGTELGAHWQLLAEPSSQRIDVGASYAMYAVLAASVLTLARPAKLAGLLVVGAGVLVPFLLDPDLTSTGHVLSVSIGIAIMAAGQLNKPARTARARRSQQTLRWPRRG